MHSKSSPVRCAVATLLAAPLLLVLLATGCSSAQRDASANPAHHAPNHGPSDTAASGTHAVDGDAAAERPRISEEQALGELLEEILEDGPFPGEEVTESPLDVLAAVSPELDAARLEHERELLDA